MVLSQNSKKPDGTTSTCQHSVASNNRWVIVQLSPVGEKEKNLDLITRSVRKILNRDLEVFIPAISEKVRDESQTMFYMDGYIFVLFDERVNYLKMQDTNYFKTVLCRNITVNGKRERVYSLLKDRDLDSMKRGMKNMKLGEFSENDNVKIVKGNYKNMTGVISNVYEGEEVIQVSVPLRSKFVLFDFPSSYLVKIESP